MDLNNDLYGGNGGAGSSSFMKSSRRNKSMNLDSLHKEKLEQLEKEQLDIQEKKLELEKLQSKISRLEKIPIKETTDQDIRGLYFLKETAKTLQDVITRVENNKNLYDYFLQSGDILYQYYDAIENSSNTPKCTSKTILEIFDGKPTQPADDGSGGSNSGRPSKQGLLNKYLNIHHRDLVPDTATAAALETAGNDEVCRVCLTEKVLFHQVALMVCPSCGDTEIVLLDSNRPSYKEPPREITFYSYKRINHFNEWLAQFQAKESTDIPEEVYNKILLELKKERISNMAALTPVKMKEILKKLRYNKYYEHIPHIINHLNSIPAPIMTRDMEEKLRSMFKQIQAPFMKYCPDDRNNFLSYSYVLHKFCQLLNLDEFLVCFPLLKSREKLHKHDQIWEQICQELQWEFIKSV
jgi:predicted RNA-binding Zn-ribbon protein involved in translation (DUF1610 family)